MDIREIWSIFLKTMLKKLSDSKRNRNVPKDLVWFELVLVLFCGPWILRSSDGLSIVWDIIPSPREIEPPSTKQLELQTPWDRGGILQAVLS